MNSVFQALASVKPLLKYFIIDFHEEDIKPSPHSVAREFRILLMKLWSRDTLFLFGLIYYRTFSLFSRQSHAIHPDRLIQAINSCLPNKFQFANVQEDCSDFLLEFLVSYFFRVCLIWNINCSFFLKLESSIARICWRR